jgi:hypothetical protein
MIVIGCFEVEKLDGERWRCKNTLTTYEHISYGTEAEIRELLEAQTVSWNRRLEPKASGKSARLSSSRWSTQNTAEVARLKQEKEKGK